MKSRRFGSFVVALTGMVLACSSEERPGPSSVAGTSSGSSSTASTASSGGETGSSGGAAGSGGAAVTTNTTTGQTIAASSSGAGGMAPGVAVGWLATDFSVMDVNPGSPRYNEAVSPKDYLKQVSGWYFGHAT